MTPWELRKATDDLRDAWNDLNAQVVGKGVKGRADVSDDLKNEIAASVTAFRSWYEGLIGRPLEEALGLYSDEFQNQLAVYRRVAAKSVAKLKTLKESPKFKPLAEWVERPSGLGFSSGVVVTLGLLALGWFLLNKQKKGK